MPFEIDPRALGRMSSPIPPYLRDNALAHVLGAQRLEADTALIAIAERFARCDQALVHERLDDAARELFGAAADPVSRQADRLAALLTNRLALMPAATDHRALLIDRALAEHRAHPVVIATIGHEVARRAGLRTRVCRSDGDWWIALGSPRATVLIGCGAGGPPAGRVHAICAHAIAHAVLAHLRDDGPPDWRSDAGRVLRRIA